MVDAFLGQSTLISLDAGIAYALANSTHLSLSPPEHLLSFAFLMKVIPSGVRCDPKVILICILLRAEDAEVVCYPAKSFFPKLLSAAASSLQRAQEFIPQPCL